jgi:hypothetical protein
VKALGIRDETIYIVSMTRNTNPDPKIEVQLEDGRTAILTLKPGFIARLVDELDDDFASMDDASIERFHVLYGRNPGLETDDFEFVIR